MAHGLKAYTCNPSCASIFESDQYLKTRYINTDIYMIADGHNLFEINEPICFWRHGLKLVPVEKRQPFKHTVNFHQKSRISVKAAGDPHSTPHFIWKVRIS